ncbi:glycosyl transferase [Geomonas silvestris]|uniref:Glycosyl transferase n=1 Tax=Geomonas silvestris TaxID=2740184 RepID=A0A6V8MK22_9BACT|nr:glycosyltransferase family 4 protein [Geomonas silvestris]GFO60316.1 glycosyl transferase [Geomonas silvestris]
MKILAANNFYYLRGGSERVYFDEIEMLQAHGHEVWPFTRHFPENIDSRHAAHFAPPIEYDQVPLPVKAAVACKLIYSFEVKKYLGAYLDKVRPDLLHAHNIYGRLTTSTIDCAAERGIPVVMTLHDNKLVCPSYLMLRHGEVCERCKEGRFYHCLLSRCHKGSLLPSLINTAEAYFNRVLRKYDKVQRFLCPSRFLLEQHASSGIPRSKLVYLPNSLKVRNLTPCFEPGSYVLYAGRLSPEKGIIPLLEAVRGTSVSLKIAGDGPLKERILALLSGGAFPNVDLLGYRTGKELQDLFRGASFLVVPSQCYENAPMAILEAFSLGKPVIGCNLGGIPELVAQDETGLLVSPSDVLQLREAVLALSADSGKVRRLGMNARWLVENEFNDELHYQRLIEVYQDASLGKGDTG